MNLQLFMDVLKSLSELEIRALADRLEIRFASPGDEVDWWRANLAIEHLARSSRTQSQAAAMAGHKASLAVREAAERSNIPLPDSAVTGVARAADRIATGLQVGSRCAPYLAFLLDPWTAVLNRDGSTTISTDAA